MTIRKVFLFISFSSLLLSCSRYEIGNQQQDKTGGNPEIEWTATDSTFCACMEQEQTKVYFEPGTDNILWNGPSFDKVKVFLDADGTKANIYHPGYAKQNYTELVFESGDLKDEKGYYRAIYPADADNLSYKNGHFSVHIDPSQQFSQESGTSPRHSLYMVAASDDSRILNFRHATHVVKVKISCETAIKITNVRLAAAGGECICGDFDIFVEGGNIKSSSVAHDGTSYVEQTMGGIACQSGTTRSIFLMLAPGTYEKGFVLSISYRYNETNYVYSVSSPKTSDGGVEPFKAERGSKTVINVTVPMMSTGRGRLDGVDYVDLSANETANCYVVNNSAAGCTGQYYKFKADVRGNGVKPSYGSTITAENSNCRTAEAYYSDGLAFIDKTHGKNGFSYDDGYIYFKTSSATACGSTLVSVKNNDGKTLWSWHIWSQPDLADIEVSGVGTFLNMNLGQRSLNFSSTGGNGFYYQWGRKDPMPQIYNTSDYGSMLNGTYYPPFISAQAQSLAATIQNPHKFRSGGAPYNDLASGYGTDLWNLAKSKESVTKTMLDPCPPGYSVPSYNQWTNSALKGKLTFPMSSYRITGGDNTQKIYADKWGSAGYCWAGYAPTATTSKISAIRIWATSNGQSIGVSSESGTDAVFGCNVRCVKNGTVVQHEFSFEESEITVDEGKSKQLILLEKGQKYDLVKNIRGIRLSEGNLETISVNNLGYVNARTQGKTTVTAKAADGSVLATADITVNGTSDSFDYLRPISASMIYSNKDVNYGPTNGKTAAQSFKIASDGEYFIGGICNNTSYPHIYLQRMLPGGVNGLDHMTFQYAGHCNNFEVETTGGEHYIWLPNLGGKNGSGEYMNEQIVTRVKYEAGKEYLPEDCTDKYWFGKVTGSLQMAIDFDNDLIAVGWGGPYLFKVYKLSDVMKTSVVTKTMQQLTRGGNGSSPITAEETVTPQIKVHDCSKLTPIAKLEFQAWRCGGDGNHAYQGCAIRKNRIYLIYGNGGTGPYDATISAIDFSGKVVSGPNHLALDDNKEAYKALGLGGGYIDGYFEPESLQIREESGKMKMYVGFIWQDASPNRVWEHCTLKINPEN